MSEELYRFKIHDNERKIITNALNMLNSQKIEENRITDSVDDLLSKYIDAKSISRTHNETR